MTIKPSKSQLENVDYNFLQKNVTHHLKTRLKSDIFSFEFVEPQTRLLKDLPSELHLVFFSICHTLLGCITEEEFVLATCCHLAIISW